MPSCPATRWGGRLAVLAGPRPEGAPAAAVPDAAAVVAAAAVAGASAGSS